MTIRKYRANDDRTRDIAVLTTTGHFLSGDQIDALIMRSWTAYGHRTPAEKVAIIQENEIIFNSTRGINAYVIKHRAY